MIWYPSLNNNKTTDNYINKYAYNNVVTQGEGIDLRLEIHWILYGKESFPPRVPKGHWIVYRKYDITKKSNSYSNRTHEGVGGPPYQYTDYLLRTRKVPIPNPGLDPEKVGIILVDVWKYYFEYTFEPIVGDDIFEVDLKDHTLTPKIEDLKFTQRFSITASSDYRLENGNIQYYMAIGKLDEVTY
jgi:hypothetical protein